MFNLHLARCVAERDAESKQTTLFTENVSEKWHVGDSSRACITVGGSHDVIHKQKNVAQLISLTYKH